MPVGVHASGMSHVALEWKECPVHGSAELDKTAVAGRRRDTEEHGRQPVPRALARRWAAARRGESYYQKALEAVTRGMYLPRITGDNWDDSVSITAELRPEPDNRFDANAVRVEISRHRIGYLPAEVAQDYQPHLLNLAKKGQVGTCESRLMIGPTGGISVYLHLGPPDAVAFAVDAPENSIPLSPESMTTVTGEEDHKNVLRQLAPASTGAQRWETAALGFCTIAKGKFAGQQAIEVRLGGERVGQLTRAMTQRYQQLVRDALDAGKTPICRAILRISPDKGVQVELMMPALTQSMSRGA